MIRLFRLMFWFFFGVAIAAVPMFSKAAEMPVPIPGVSTNAAGELIHTSRAGVTSVVYPSLQTTTPLSVPLPPAAGMVQPGKQLMVIPTTISPNVARVASAVIGLARLSGPVGLGLTLLPIVCAETGICSSSTAVNQLVKNMPGGFYSDFGNGIPGPLSSPQAVCDARRILLNWSPLFLISENPTNAGTYHNLPLVRVGRCADSAGNVMGFAYQSLDGSVVSVPAVESDLLAATTKLAAATNRMGDIVNGLNSLGQPIPIDKPVLSPVSATTPSETTVNRDSAGNIVNTTTTNTTTNISPVTNTSTTNTVNVTQTTNTTTTGPTGAVTSTTVKSAEPPKPDDPEIGFDDVPDVNLERQELPLNMAAPSSWGEGSCPPDPSVSVMGHPIAVPVHVVCDYMVGVRGAVIALFALISAYIVIGVKFEG